MVSVRLQMSGRREAGRDVRLLAVQGSYAEFGRRALTIEAATEDPPVREPCRLAGRVKVHYTLSSGVYTGRFLDSAGTYFEGTGKCSRLQYFTSDDAGSYTTPAATEAFAVGCFFPMPLQAYRGSTYIQIPLRIPADSARRPNLRPPIVHSLQLARLAARRRALLLD